MDSNSLKQKVANISDWPSFSDSTEKASAQPSDHYISRDGVECAGIHLIIDFWGAQKLNNLEAIEDALRKSVTAANATLLHIHLHHFSDSGGISGVAVLAESHISVHTWPERDYAAFDVFMCGDAKPENCIEVLKKAFKPDQFKITELLRGETSPAARDTEIQV